jgi:hypothetical protein
MRRCAVGYSENPHPCKTRKDGETSRYTFIFSADSLRFGGFGYFADGSLVCCGADWNQFCFLLFQLFRN